MGPLIAFIGEKFKFRKYLKVIGVKSQYLETIKINHFVINFLG